MTTIAIQHDDVTMTSGDDGLANRIRLLRGRRSQKSIAAASGGAFSQGAISLWENGDRRPEGDNALALAKALGCSIEYLLEGRGPQETHASVESPKTPPQPVSSRPPQPNSIRRIEARVPIGAEPGAWNEGGLTLSREDLAAIGRPASSLAVVGVIGDAMTPTINDGDDLIIDTGDTRMGDGVWVLALNGGLVVRRLQLLPERALLVLCDNTRYPPREIEPGPDLRAIGRVLRVRMKKV